MNREEYSAAKRAKFAIECRKVRLLIAENPGISTLDISKKLGFRPGFHLMKMKYMGIIECGGFESQGGWFVVPQ